MVLTGGLAADRKGDYGDDPQPPTSRRPGRVIRALVVAADAALRAEIERVSACHAGTVTTCADGESAVAAFRADPFPLVVVDDDAPSGGGTALIRCLRALPGGERAVVVVVTGDAHPDHLTNLLTAGADDYLLKPVVPAQLDHRLGLAARLTAAPGEAPPGDPRSPETGIDFRALVEHVPVLTYVELVDDEGTIVYLSPQVEDVVGYTAEECMVERGLWQQWLHPDDRERVLAEHRRTNETGEPFSMDYRFVLAHGRTIWLRDEARLVRDEQGHPLCWHGYQIDMTQQKEAAEALRASEERLRLALGHAAMAIWEWDLVAGRVAWSDGMGPLYGLPAGTTGPDRRRLLRPRPPRRP